jgi:Ni/Co efflux regulator RcnB
MKIRRWIWFCVATVLALSGTAALAQDHEHGKNKHDRDEGRKFRDRDEDREHHSKFDDDDRKEMRRWYDEHERDDDLPPGLAKRDRLPPGLERQLRVRHELPPGLGKKIRRCPEELEQRLPPPPPDCQHVVIGGHIVLLNLRTNIVLDIFHVEFR